MSELGGLLPAEAAVAADTVLNLLADAARDAAARAGEPDERTHQQRRADAFTGIFSAILDGRPLPYYPANFPHTQHQTFTRNGNPPPWTTSPSSSPDGAPGSSANSAGPAGSPDWGEPTTGSSASAGPASSSSPAGSAGPATSPGPAGSTTSAGSVSPTPSAGSAGSAGWPGVWSPPWMPAWWEPPSLSTRQKRRPHLVITISAETLAGWNNLPADLASYGAITAHTARDLAQHAGTADLIILNPPPNPPPDENPCEPTGTGGSGGGDSGTSRSGGTEASTTGHGAGTSATGSSTASSSTASSSPTSGSAASSATPGSAAGSTSPRSYEPTIKIPRVFGQPAEPGYRPSTDLIRDIIAIHRTCRFPGCPRPSEQCDIDHIKSYPEGQTNSSNLAPLCRHHHVLKTHGGWTLTIPPASECLPPGTVRWTSPLGVVHDVPPNDQPGTETLL